MKIIDELITYFCFFLILFGLLSLFRKMYYPYYIFFSVFLIFSISALQWSAAIDVGVKSFFEKSGLFLPVLFLIAPLHFLFTRHILGSKNSFSRSDYGHAMPAFVILVLILSFYWVTGNPKLLHAHQMTDDKQSGLASGMMAGHISIMVVMSLSLIGYAYFQWQLIKEYRMNATQRTIKKKRGLLRWLAFNTIFRAIVFTLYLGLIFFPQLTRFFPFDGISFSMIMFIHPLVDFVFFVVDPQILVGMRQDQVGKPQEISSLPTPHEPLVGVLAAPIDHIPESQEIPLTDRIRKYLVDDKSFLLEDFNLKFMARALNVHPMAISKTILLESGLSFPDHISKLKLELLDDLIKSSPEFRQYSMEAMAKEVGFKSKNAFYLSFRKLRGISPSEYFKAYLKKP